MFFVKNDYSRRLGGRLHFARCASGGRDVTVPGIVHDHAVGAEAPAQGADGSFHAGDPSPRQAVLVTVIVERNQFVLQNAIEVLPVAAVMHIHVGVGSAVSDGEAVETVVGFGPPTVEHGEIQATVQHYFLTAGA